ncbi:MAG: sigma-70 family RNA polymerase sigma factor [bacterium]
MSNKQRQFDALVRRYSQDLYRYAIWLSRDPDLAHDLVQETFTRAWKALHTLRENAAVKGWLTTILRREHARIYERKRLDLVNIDDVYIADTHDVEPEEKNHIREMREAMLKLDEKYREPLVLQVLYGFSCEEIAQKLDISKSAVMTQLFRARQKLKASIGDELKQIESGTI